MIAADIIGHCQDAHHFAEHPAVRPEAAPRPGPRTASLLTGIGRSREVQAMVMLGIANSRMKDFYDLQILARQFEFQGAVLSQAMQATFGRRHTPVGFTLPAAHPIPMNPGCNRSLET